LYRSNNPSLFFSNFLLYEGYLGIFFAFLGDNDNGRALKVVGLSLYKKGMGLVDHLVLP
jgi:hypothetical protein